MKIPISTDIQYTIFIKFVNSIKVLSIKKYQTLRHFQQIAHQIAKPPRMLDFTIEISIIIMYAMYTIILDRRNYHERKLHP